MRSPVRRAALLVSMCATLLVAACSKTAHDQGGMAPAPKEMAAPAGDSAGKRRATLATTRSVQMQVAPEAIAPLFTSTQAACEADVDSQCVVMASRLETGERAHAELTLRAAPAGIARLLARLHAGTGLVGESASSQDLAAPIVDSERQMAMAREYRDSLLALRAKGSNDIKTLMSVNEELARVQSQLESATGERAHLQQRVDTETLTVSIDSTGAHETHAWRSITDAFREFGTHLAEAAGGAITFVAYAIPWAVVLLPLAWSVRWLWRRRRGAR
jgi:hypothetical protein